MAWTRETGRVLRTPIPRAAGGAYRGPGCLGTGHRAVRIFDLDPISGSAGTVGRAQCLTSKSELSILRHCSHSRAKPINGSKISLQKIKPALPGAKLWAVTIW